MRYPCSLFRELTTKAHHYDLRLHLEGQLVSWAIPKGVLGLAPNDKDRLAIETPLHPLADAVHEGRSGPGRGTCESKPNEHHC